MRKIVVSHWITLDGFIAGPNGEMDWVATGFDEAMGLYESELVNAADTLVLGRVTYESFAGSWPHVPDSPHASEGEKEYARRLNSMRKIVFSRSLERAEWNNSTLAREIVPDEIARLKQEPGQNILIYGSASVVSSLTNLGLIDEYQLLVYPLILGQGKPLFKGIQRQVSLSLAEIKTHSSGIVRLTYQAKPS
jgi:dihydrofolate reductase